MPCTLKKRYIFLSIPPGADLVSQRTLRNRRTEADMSAASGRPIPPIQRKGPEQPKLSFLQKIKAIFVTDPDNYSPASLNSSYKQFTLLGGRAPTFSMGGNTSPVKEEKNKK